MNFLKSRNVIGNVMGQWRKQVVETGGSRRNLCNKPTEAKPEPPAVAPNPGFKIPGYKPSNFDIKMLLWSGRFKTVDQIPEFVSFEMIDGARNKMRVKFAYVMMGATVAGCVLMIILGKRAQGRGESLSGRNLEKHAKWREDYQRQREADAATAALADKPQ